MKTLENKIIKLITELSPWGYNKDRQQLAKRIISLIKIRDKII